MNRDEAVLNLEQLRGAFDAFGSGKANDRDIAALDLALTALRSGGGEVDYTPGLLDSTAPPRIWLQVDTAGWNDARDEAFPADIDGVTWQDESIGGLEVQYVRADLALPHPQPARGEAVEVWVNRCPYKHSREVCCPSCERTRPPGAKHGQPLSAAQPAEAGKVRGLETENRKLREALAKIEKLLSAALAEQARGGQS